ncbi:PREDICTED: estrogen sulfotransferase-like isoform X2 [Galeopterus variegatus]|uniref:Sulfotransferase n=1 Tax=Galeopterus variegatus TaxID=482537 RepID=A0ABM0SE50_GALVR|nr:PREDICTED: estrogen sulfotransferase-like isoform X2 [Galeopterus variegatus]
MMDPSKYDYRENFDKVHGILMYKDFVKYWDDVETFQARPDDIVIVTYPRSGTTWASEIIYLICKDGDVEKCNEDVIFNRIPFLECRKETFLNGVKQLNEMASPRILKTHLPRELLPASFWEKNCKIVYICRNAKDVAVSNYYFFQMINSYPDPGSFPEFVEEFMHGEVPYGSWFKHVISWWEERNNPHVLFILYEDMKEGLQETGRITLQ